MKSMTGLLVALMVCVSTIQAAEKHTLIDRPNPKDQQPAFKEYKGKTYRILNKTNYLVMDTAEFYLYSYNKLVQGEKIARPTTVYYFSTGANSPVQELTIFNLEKTYARNKAFVYKLHTDFSSDKDLVTYIPSLKTYKIKYAYGQSIK